MMENFEKLITNIQVGDSFSNYRRLCDYLKLPITTGNAKMAQMKKIKEYIDFRKNGNMLVVTSVHSRVPHDDKRKSRKMGINRKQFNQYKIPMEYDHRAGVYAIKLENKMYIGSTIDFRRRFLSHRYGINGFEYTKKLLDDGATFELLFLAPNSMSRKELFIKEQTMIDSYSIQSDVEVVNKGCMIHSLYKTENKQQSSVKPIWISKNDYGQAVKLLKENDFII